MITSLEKEYPDASQSILQKAKYEEKKFECKKIIPNHFNFKKILKDKKNFKTYQGFTKSFENLQLLEKLL